MIATHEVVSNLTRAKSAMENLVHEMADVTALVTGEGRVIWGNQATADWLELPHDKLHEQSIDAFFDEESWRDFSAALGSVASGLVQSTELASELRLRGQKRDVLWNLRPFRAVSQRRGIIVLLTGHDITDILQARTERSRLEAELETAQILQQRFLPPSQIKTTTLEIASFYRPAEQCSGDWWGYFDLGSGRELVCIADVTGHGAASALVTSMTQALCLSYVQRNQNRDVAPSSLIREINEIVYQTFRGDMYMTFFALIFDAKRGMVTGSNAAHNFPLVIRAKPMGKNPEAILVQGNPVGHESNARFVDQEIRAERGDRFILYTDGLTECRNPENKMYGSGAFRRSIIRHQAEDVTDLRDSLVNDALVFFAEQPLADDVTLAVIKVR